MGIPINEEYYNKRPSIKEGLVVPKHSEEAREVYIFLMENQHYTVNRGGGMGMDIAISPDMLKLKEVGDIEGIDIYRYKKHCIDFVGRQTKLEQKKD